MLKNEKAPGGDKITTELLKKGVKAPMTKLKQLFGKI